MTIGDRELDAAVTEAMGIKAAWHRGRLCKAEHADIWYAAMMEADIPSYHATIDFHLVRREIEQRGWGWASRYVPSIGKCRFEVIVLPAVRGVNNRFKVWAETEELAGCRAFLKACEAE